MGNAIITFFFKICLFIIKLLATIYKKITLLFLIFCGGEGGIRTRDRVNPIHAFQACALNLSATSPAGWNIIQ